MAMMLETSLQTNHCEDLTLSIDAETLTFEQETSKAMQRGVLLIKS